VLAMMKAQPDMDETEKLGIMWKDWMIKWKEETAKELQRRRDRERA